MEKAGTRAEAFQALQDGLDLMELAARAARTFDENDAAGYADCFLEDGLYESSRIGLRTPGRAQLMEMCRGRGGGRSAFLHELRNRFARAWRDDPIEPAAFVS